MVPGMRVRLLLICLCLSSWAATASADTIKYLGNYPSDRENGWSQKIQGVTHDGYNWYFAQERRIWSFPITHNLSAKVKKAKPSVGIQSTDLKPFIKEFNCKKRHFGDPVFSDGYLFIPVEGCPGGPHIVVLSKTLQHLATAKAVGMDHLPWLAVHPGTQILYTSEFKNVKHLTRYQYKMKKQGSQWKLTLKTLSPAKLPKNKTFNRVQGGVVSPYGVLYLVSDKKNHGIYANGNIGTSKPFLQDFEKVAFKPGKPQYEELEGITWWDIDRYRLRHNPDNPTLLAPGISGGQLHLVMLDNDNNDKGASDGAPNQFWETVDEIYFKHFRVKTPVKSTLTPHPYKGVQKYLKATPLCFKTHSGHYFRQNPDNLDEVRADGNQCGKYESFELVSLQGALKNGGKVALRAPVKLGKVNRYLSAQPPKNGAWLMEANRTKIKQWETFTLLLPGQKNGAELGLNHLVQLRTHHGRYLVAEKGGGGLLHANRKVAKQWESFDLRQAQAQNLQQVCIEGELKDEVCRVWKVSEFPKLLGSSCEEGKPGCRCMVKPGSKAGRAQIMCIEAKRQTRGPRRTISRSRRSAARPGRGVNAKRRSTAAGSENQCQWKSGKWLKSIRVGSKDYNLCILQIGQRPLKDINKCHIVPKLTRGKAYLAPMKAGCPYWVSGPGAGVYRKPKLK